MKKLPHLTDIDIRVNALMRYGWDYEDAFDWVIRHQKQKMYVEARAILDYRIRELNQTLVSFFKRNKR